MSRILRLTHARATLAVAAATLAFAMPVAAQQTVKREPIKPITDVAGSATFREYCTVCHGTSGRGDGPAAKALTTAPADLTQIAKKHGGKFPFANVRMTITGETTLAAHGTRDMPMWGPLFRHAQGDSTTELRLRNLVAYIETLQEK